METPNPGGRRETLRDTTRTAEIAEIKVKMWKGHFEALLEQPKRRCKMHAFRLHPRVASLGSCRRDVTPEWNRGQNHQQTVARSQS